MEIGTNIAIAFQDPFSATVIAELQKCGSFKYHIHPEIEDGGDMYKCDIIITMDVQKFSIIYQQLGKFFDKEYDVFILVEKQDGDNKAVSIQNMMIHDIDYTELLHVSETLAVKGDFIQIFATADDYLLL